LLPLELFFLFRWDRLLFFIEFLFLLLVRG